MLVLSRKKGQRIFVGDSVVVTVLECRGGTVRLGFMAPQDIEIVREELGADFRDIPPLPPSRPRLRLKKG